MGDDLVEVPLACTPPGVVEVRAVLVDALGWEVSAPAASVNSNMISSLIVCRTSSSVNAFTGFAVAVEVVVGGVVGCCCGGGWVGCWGGGCWDG